MTAALNRVNVRSAERLKTVRRIKVPLRSLKEAASRALERHGRQSARQIGAGVDADAVGLADGRGHRRVAVHDHLAEIVR